jgi:hypothetical protein
MFSAFAAVFLMLKVGNGIMVRDDSWDADLNLHDAATVAKFNARCLDGSNGGFYYRKSSTTSAATKWKVTDIVISFGFLLFDVVVPPSSTSKVVDGAKVHWTVQVAALGYWGLPKPGPRSCLSFGKQKRHSTASCQRR